MKKQLRKYIGEIIYRDNDTYGTANDFYSNKDGISDLPKDIFFALPVFEEITKEDGSKIDIVGFFSIGNLSDCFNAKTYEPLGYILYDINKCRIRFRKLSYEEYNLYLKIIDGLDPETYPKFNQLETIIPDSSYVPRDASKMVGFTYAATLAKIKSGEIEAKKSLRNYRIPGTVLIKYLSKIGKAMYTEI